jgi:DNA-binding MurR/RpiR family transcriptional regulator
MTGQTNDFLTIEDAVKLTGTSESTVRRFVRSLDADQRQKHVRKEGRRVLIAKALLCDAFGVVPGMEDQDAANDLVSFQRQQLQDAVRIQSKLTEQNDRLLT